MKLIEATIKNFMPYKGEQKVFFPMDYRQNVMLIFGDNMRGKTSFLNAIRWCFYNKALGRYLKEIPVVDLVNVDAAAEGDWSVSVHLRFEHNGSEYDLRRSLMLKEMVYRPKTDSDFVSEVMLRRDGEILRGDQIVYEINQILPEDISRFFLFDGELLQEYEMLLNDRDEQGKCIKESIEKVLGVPALTNASDEISILLAEARKRQTKDARQIESVMMYSEQIRSLQSLRESYEIDFKQLTVRHYDIRSQIDILDKDLDSMREIITSRIKMEALERDLKQKAEEIKNLENSKLELLRDAWKDLIQPKLQQQLLHIERELSDILSEQKNKTISEARLADLHSILRQSACPTCNQHILESQKADLSNEIRRLETLLASPSENLDYDSLAAMRNRLTKIVPTGACDEVPRIYKKIRELNLDLVKIEGELEQLRESLRNHDSGEVAKKQSMRDQLHKDLGVVERDLKKVKHDIDENERKQAHFSKQIESDAQARSYKSTKLVQAYTSLKEIFMGSVDALRDSLKDEVEELATKAFQKLSTDNTFIGLKINANYGLTILDRENREISQRSAGAEQIVALSLIDGLNKTSRKLCPIIMDTPLGRLDLKHRSNVLTYLPEMSDQVILLVHEGEIKKNEIIDSLRTRIGCTYSIEKVSSSESRLTRGIDG